MKISVEAWHIYGLKLPIKWSHTECMAIQDFSGTDFWYELETSSKVSDLLEAEWHKIETIWFNDNILPNITTDVPRMWRFYSRMLTRVSEIFTSLWKPDFTQKYENNLIPRAKSESIPEIIAAIESDEEWCYEHQKNWIKWPRINKKQQKIRLKWYASHPDIPSCEVLDFTLYKEKLEESDATITILPESMKDQQNKVKKLILLTKNNANIIVLFHNWETLSSSDYWWSSSEIKEIYDDLIKKLRI